MAARPRGTVNIAGMGRVYDWRGTGLLPPSGGAINPLVMVEHIPVVPNVHGTADFVTLANVLRAQGLSLQAATDAEGNVALYNRLDALCWQARGANSASCGVEHMHMSTGEPWTRLQLRASGYMWWRAHRFQGIPMRRGSLANGGRGLCRVTRTGHVSHQLVSATAGYNDRTDPGPKYDWHYVEKAARYFSKRRTFKGF